MRALVLAGIVTAVLWPAAAPAQSLEKTYADLCADSAKAKGETCAALAQALIVKLQSQKAAGSAESAPASKAAAAPSAATDEAEQRAAWRKRWGLFADMVGKEWFASPRPDMSHDVNMMLIEGGIAYRWKVPGESFEIVTLQADGSASLTQNVRWDESSQTMMTPDGSKYVVEPDGSILGLEHTGPIGTLRSRTVRQPDGVIQTVNEKKEGGAWVVWNSGRLIERTPERVAQERQRLLAAEQQRLIAEQQRKQEELRQQQEAQQRKQQRGQVLGSLLIAGVGAATANAYGGTSEQVLGGAMKGLQIANADHPAAGALGDISQTLLTQGGGSSSAGTSAIGGATAAGSYSALDPVDMGAACAGFTESNYRERALQAPGDDAHLYAACGQAFELYHMYRNAIRQGYGEADAMRTYEAHRGAAANAVHYYETRRAD